MSIPTVVIIGRPNVGKSTLFNRLLGTKKAITSLTPGTTRDRLFGDISWNNTSFRLVDTAGLFFDPHKEMTTDIVDQVEMAIDLADVILFTIDAKSDITQADEKIAALLRKQSKPVILLANKVEHNRTENQLFGLHKLGFGEYITISGLSGRKTGDLLDRVVELLPQKKLGNDQESSDHAATIAIVGRPNVGKSTMTNTLLGEKRVCVSKKAGTTRDAIDVEVTVNDKKYIFIDTAGVRRKGKVERGIEYYSVLRALQAIDRSDIVILLIDASEGITHQDKILLGEVLTAKKGLLLLANKWDLVQERHEESQSDLLVKDFMRILSQELKFATWIPIMTISALTKKRVHKLWEAIDEIQQQLAIHIPTSELKKKLFEWKSKAPLPHKRGQELRLLSVKQKATHPPTFEFRVNNPKIVHFSYARFLENQIRHDFSIQKVPIDLQFKKASFSQRKS